MSATASPQSSAPQNAVEWNALIDEAVTTPDPVLSNFRVTRIHYMLSQAMLDALGPETGANFHSWAVWGSRKAGVTIRQQDKDQASRDATIVAGIVGALVGVAVGFLFSWLTAWSTPLSIALWVAIGVATGGYCGFLLAGYTRQRASQIILEGNQIVLADIGRETARYLDFVNKVEAGEADRDETFAEFLAKFRPGPGEEGGQDLMRKAFEQYEQARRSNDLKTQHESACFANCLAVLHEHIRLQPYIGQSLPFLIKQCVTTRLMTYSVGEKLLAVHDDVPPLADTPFPPTLSKLENKDLVEFLHGVKGWDVGRGTLQNTKANDWTCIRQRMGYIVNLFRTRHTAPEVVAPPYVQQQLEAIAAGEPPAQPW